jgi:hypothetical protein
VAVSRPSVGFTLLLLSHSGRGLSIRTTTYFSASALNYARPSIVAKIWYNDQIGIQSGMSRAWITATAWPQLPEAVRSTVLAIVRKAVGHWGSRTTAAQRNPRVALEEEESEEGPRFRRGGLFAGSICSASQPPAGDAQTEDAQRDRRRNRDNRSIHSKGSDAIDIIGRAGRDYQGSSLDGLQP